MTPGSRTLIVVAADFRMAEQYARRHRLGRNGREWRYIAMATDGYGYYGYYGGDYVAPPGRSEVTDYLDAHGFTRWEAWTDERGRT